MLTTMIVMMTMAVTVMRTDAGDDDGDGEGEEEKDGEEEEGVSDAGRCPFQTRTQHHILVWNKEGLRRTVPAPWLPSRPSGPTAVPSNHKYEDILLRVRAYPPLLVGMLRSQAAAMRGRGVL